MLVSQGCGRGRNRGGTRGPISCAELLGESSKALEHCNAVTHTTHRWASVRGHGSHVESRAHCTILNPVVEAPIVCDGITSTVTSVVSREISTVLDPLNSALVPLPNSQLNASSSVFHVDMTTSAEIESSSVEKKSASPRLRNSP